MIGKTNRNKNYIIRPLLIFIFFSSCNKEEVFPLPEAFFDLSLEFSGFDGAFIGEKIDNIQFTNRSRNAVSFEWDFDDGITSTEENPSHTYIKRGRYKVRLTAKNKNGETSSAESKIFIGDRIFSAISLLKYNPLKPNNEPWDTDNSPDFILFFGEVDNPENSYTIRFPDDLEESDLPYGGAFGLSDFDVIFTDKDWFWIVLDDDQDLGFGEEFMFEATVNPATFGPRELLRGGGIFEINQGQDADGNQTSKYALSVGWLSKWDQ